MLCESSTLQGVLGAGEGLGPPSAIEARVAELGVELFIVSLSGGQKGDASQAWL